MARQPGGDVMTAARRRLAALLAIAAFACIAGTVAASVLGDRWVVFTAVAAVVFLVAALAVVRGRGQS